MSTLTRLLRRPPGAMRFLRIPLNRSRPPRPLIRPIVARQQRWQSTSTLTAQPTLPVEDEKSSVSPDSSSSPTPPLDESRRTTASFYISKVFPIYIVSWDPRPKWASVREESIMENLHDIASEIEGNGFRVENWEIARKDGGVFLHFSYIPPEPETADASVAGNAVTSGAGQGNVPDEAPGIRSLNALPEMGMNTGNSPARLFIPQLLEAAKRHGGLPNWLGQWFGFRWGWEPGSSFFGNNTAGRTLYTRQIQRADNVWKVGGGGGEAAENKGDSSPSTSRSSSAVAGTYKGNTGPDGKEDTGEAGLNEATVLGSGTGLVGVQALAGGGRVWLVKGRQWTEDMNRFPSKWLKVEFEGADVSQEMLYSLFRPYGRLTDILPPTPPPSGSLRTATIAYSKFTPACIAISCLHGFVTPTNTADFLLRATGREPPNGVATTRLRIYYDRPLKAHVIRDWMSSHPRLMIPFVAFLVGTLSYTFFDPIRAFFVRSKLENLWDLDQYPLLKSIRSKFHSSFSIFSSSSGTGGSSAALGKDAWQDRVDAEKTVDRWLSEFPSTFITITGPPGSGKASLVSRVLGTQQKPSLTIDCSEVGKAKTDAAMLDSLAEQTGYWPVFSFLSSMNGLIDLAAVGLIGQKAGFATPPDQQLRSVLEVVGGALKDASAHTRQQQEEDRDRKIRRAEASVEREERIELIRRGGWHDGRLDCVAGNGVMSELGYGIEPLNEKDLGGTRTISSPSTSTVPISSSSDTAGPSSSAASNEPGHEGHHHINGVCTVGATATDIDAEAEAIRTLPIVVLKNFAQKSARGDLWNVLSEWGAGLIENKVAHVIVITEGPTATKSLTKALPSKPLNIIGLADADEANSLSYVQDKLTGLNGSSNLSTEDEVQIGKLGGRMVDLEMVVYKVRTGSKIADAVEDIVSRNVVELRKLAFGDDAEDAKGLPWSRQQAWKVVSELAKHDELSYATLLQDFPFKGSEQSLKALEEHELVSISYTEGRPSKVRPGKPVFHYAFELLVNDPVFKATSQIDYNTALISKAETDIRSCEEELAHLKDISTDGGDAALGINDGRFLGLGRSSAVRERAKWLLEKMGKSVDKLNGLERDNAEMMKMLVADK